MRLPVELSYLEDYYPREDKSPFKLYSGYYHFGMKLTAEQALHGFTAGAAYAGFAETEVGRLAPGLRADFGWR